MKSIILFILLNLITITAKTYSQTGSHFSKVIWIVFENTSFAPTIKQPDFARFANYGILFSQMRAEAHPSQANYIAMIAGSTLGVKGDKNVDLNSAHVGDLLEKNNRDWRVYAEGYPGNCFIAPGMGDYVRKHIPFLSFINVTSNQERCSKIVNEKTFWSDLENDLLPEFTMYIPDMKNNGHDTGVDYAGRWLTKNFGDLLARPEVLKNTLLIVTFDESDLRSLSNQIYTVLIGNNVVKGRVNDQKLNHYALLKLIEDEFNLGNLGRYDLSAPKIENIWKN